MEEAQVTEENAEASSYEVLQSLTRSEMGMSLKSLPESPMKTDESAKTDESPAQAAESPAKTSEAEQTADAEQKEAATSDKKEECAGTSAASKPAEVEKPKEPEDLDVLGWFEFLFY